jgi:hypothetical protein
MYAFTVAYLAGLRYTSNIKRALAGSRLRTLFVIDEARLVLKASRNVSVFGESYFNEIVTKTVIQESASSFPLKKQRVLTKPSAVLAF